MTKHYAVFIGRFQPYHRAHHRIVEEALEVADELIIVVGSATSPLTPRNPFTFKQRREIILSALDYKQKPRVHIVPIDDYLYNNQRWIGAVQATVYSVIHRNWTPDSYKVSLIGHSKDHTSFYLKMFPSWDSIEVPMQIPMSSTELRDKFYRTHFMFANCPMEVVKDYAVNPDHERALFQYLMRSVDYGMAKRRAVLDEYQAKYGKGPFVTVDAVVVQSGYILMIKRGDGSWALPGGFLDLNETIIEGTVRELREETKLKVPEPVLIGSIRETKVYDAPHRDERARIITHASLIELKDGPLPKVKGSDDAMEARWWSISQVMKMRPDTYSDHYDIITDIMGV